MRIVIHVLHRAREKIALSWLRGVSAATQRRIDAGDLDFDDVLYRVRDASNALLEVMDTKPKMPKTPALDAIRASTPKEG